MTISAKRFKFPDQESVAILDFTRNDSSSVYNSPNNQMAEISANMEEFLSNSVQTLPNIVNPIAKQDNPLIRIAKGITGTISDVTGLKTDSIDSLIDTLLPGNTQAQSAFGRLPILCKNGALGNMGGFGKPYNPSMDCNGHQRNVGNSANGCSASRFGGVLGQYTNGNYSTNFFDFDSMLKSLMGLSNFGYDLNMCGIFGSMMQGLPYGVQSRASGGLLGMLGNKGNTLGFMDLAAASTGLATLLENPSGITTAFAKFIIPKDIKENGLNGLADGLDSAAGNIDHHWGNSRNDGLISIADRNRYTGSLGNVYNSRLMNNIFSEDDIDVMFNANNNIRDAVYIGSNGVNSEELGKGMFSI